MEAAGVAGEAAIRGIPFYCIRVVSDASTDAMPFDFNRYRKAGERFDHWAVAWAAMSRPFSRIPALLQLRRRCQFASNRLGEFLAGCHF
jgi:hypothetical protein